MNQAFSPDRYRGSQVVSMAGREFPSFVFQMADLRKGPNVNREQLLAALQEAGFDTSCITNETPDAVLSEILRLLQDAPPSGKQPSGDAAQMSAARSFYRAHSDKMKKLNFSESDFLTGYKLARKANKELTPQQFCGQK
jgi:hypothetical protein